MTELDTATGAATPIFVEAGDAARPSRRRRPPISALRRGCEVAASIAIFLTGWLVLSRWAGETLIPGPSTTFDTGRGLFETGEIFTHLGATLRRVAVGYLLGLAVGIGVGFLLGRVVLADRVLTPIIVFLRTTPPMALIPVAIIWFGIGESSKYFIVAWGTVLGVFFPTYDGVKRVPQVRQWAARCLGATRWQALRDVVLPTALPSIWTGARMGLGFAFMSVVAAEMIAADQGVGYLIMHARVLVRVDQMFVGLFVLAATGLLADALLVRVVGGWALRRYLAHLDR